MKESSADEKVKVQRQPDDGLAQGVMAGLPVPEVCRELVISSATFYKWRANYEGIDASLTLAHERA